MEKRGITFSEAVKLDPGFAQAYALMGWNYFTSFWNQWSENPQADLQHASESAREALALDDSNSDALAVLSELDWMQGRLDDQRDCYDIGRDRALRRRNRYRIIPVHFTSPGG